MKISVSDRSPMSEGPDGHVVRELLGMSSMNVSKYSVAHIVAQAGSHGVSRQNQFDEILIVIKGRGTVQQDYVTHELEPTDVLLLPSGTRYSIDAGADEDFEMWAICVPAFRPEWSNTGSAKRDWREYQVPRGADRLREMRDHDKE